VLSDLAVAGASVYVATLDVPLTYTNLDVPAPTRAGRSISGEVEALSLASGKVEWDTRLPQLPVGAVTVSNDLLLTALYNGVLVGMNRSTGAIVYRRQLPTSTNSPIAIAGLHAEVSARRPRKAMPTVPL
jgi:outer membrane protein assembly factor BamB